MDSTSSCIKPPPSWGKIFQKLILSVRTDLIALLPWQMILVTLFAMIVIAFSVLDFNALIFPGSKSSILKWMNDTLDGRPLWERILMTFSGLASFSGVLCVVLASLGRYSNYFWGMINTLSYGLAALAYGYAGDAQLNILFFFPMQLVGMRLWFSELESVSSAEGSQVVAKSMTWVQRLGVLVLAAALAVIFYFEIPAVACLLTGEYTYQHRRVPHILDSIAVALSVLAQILLTKRYWEQWVLWISVDIVQIAMFSGVGGFGIDFNIVFMWSLFLINALCGVKVWYRRAHPAVSKLRACLSESDEELGINSRTHLSAKE
jgi:nicotinamide mononucleotide transporter PnuC